MAEFIIVEQYHCLIVFPKPQIITLELESERNQAPNPTQFDMNC
jgi:hypothetical protein